MALVHSALEEIEMYLGEKNIDIASHPIYGKWNKKDWAIYFIEMYGQIDGAHHKAWVLDRVMRILLGAPIFAKVASWDDHEDEYRFSVGTCDAYDQWIEEYKSDGEYEYFPGVAP